MRSYIKIPIIFIYLILYSILLRNPNNECSMIKTVFKVDVMRNKLSAIMSVLEFKINES